MTSTSASDFEAFCREAFDWAYVEGTIRTLCDLAEDLTSWRRLGDVREKVPVDEAGGAD